MVISGRAPHLAGDGHQRRTVRIGVREAHHKKARSSNAWCFFFLTCAAGCFIIRMISDVCGAVRPAVKLRQAKKGTAMREEKASALPLLLDVRRMDENNRAYAYRMLRKNIMTLAAAAGLSAERGRTVRTAGHEPHTGTRSADDAEKRVACGCSACSAAALCPRSAFHT